MVKQRKKQECQFCVNHNVPEDLRRLEESHKKYICKYANCECKKCVKTYCLQKIAALNQKISPRRRKENQHQHMKLEDCDDNMKIVDMLIVTREDVNYYINYLKHGENCLLDELLKVFDNSVENIIEWLRIAKDVTANNEHTVDLILNTVDDREIFDILMRMDLDNELFEMFTELSPDIITSIERLRQV